jgi:hypothetical protein
LSYTALVQKHNAITEETDIFYIWQKEFTGMDWSSRDGF